MTAAAEADSMLASRLYGNKLLRLEHVPLPSIRSDEALVRVHAVGVCATDLEIYHGSMSYFTQGLAQYPVIPGHEWAGEIVELGDAVTGFAVGDRVVGETTLACCHCESCKRGLYNLCPHRRENGILNKDGAAAEYMAFPARSLYKFNSGLSFEGACLIEPAAVAYRAAAKLGIMPDDTVAVLGAGTIGLLCVQMAKRFGARSVTVIDTWRNRLEKGLELGADDAIDAGERMPDAAAGKFSAVIEATGHPEAVQGLFSLASPGARLGLLGLCGGHKPAVDVDKIVTGDMTIFGSLGSPGVWSTVVRMVGEGEIDTERIISHRLPLHRLDRAFGLMEQRDPGVIKIVLSRAELSS